jgi:Ca2+-binding EF-hand superfamily protein
MLIWLKRASALVCFAAVLACSQPVSAQSPGVTPAATRLLSQRLTAGMTLDKYLQALGAQFRAASINGQTISEADMQLHTRMAAAFIRSTALMMIMAADLDGDGVVTEDELRQFLRYQHRMEMSAPGARGASVEERVEAEVRKFMEADTDHDGKITFAEALGYAKSRPEFSGVPFNALVERAREFMAFDANGDGVVTLAEVEAAGEAFFRTVDANGDGVVSAEELTILRQRSAEPTPAVRRSAEEAAARREAQRHDAEAARARKEADERAQCAMPKASEEARVMLLGARESEAVSTVTIGSQDTAVGTGGIVVEPGAEPLYLVVLTREATIWRVTGAVERVERLVLAGDTATLGATGLPAGRVSFLGRASCIRHFTDVPSTHAAAAAAAVKRETGKEPALVKGRYSISDFIVPSGEVRTQRPAQRMPVTVQSQGGSLRIETGRSTVVQKDANTLVIENGGSSVTVRTGPTNLREEMLRTSPGGVVDIDPAAVVSNKPAERYQVLPGIAGLQQLVESGAVSQNGRDEYLIRQKIRLPPELHGAVKFLLLRGVPAPDGEVDRSCVISEETGERLNGKQPCR